MSRFKNIVLAIGCILAAGIIMSSSVTSSAAEADNKESTPIHGIYVSAHVAGTGSMMDDIIAHIDETNINAVVIDVKTDEGTIAFDMDSELIDSLGVEDILVKDMPGLLKTLHEHDVYVIARCVAFRDPFIDEVRPEWMLHTKDGAVYEDSKGKDYPDLYPYETIDAAMKYSATELKTVNPRGDRQQAGVRPWLQGFTASYLSKYRRYGAEEVKEQIKAVNDNGVDSWIIWNPACKYAWDAFKD